MSAVDLESLAARVRELHPHVAGIKAYRTELTKLCAQAHDIAKPVGQWTEWCKAAGIEERSARRYVATFKKADEATGQTVRSKPTALERVKRLIGKLTDAERSALVIELTSSKLSSANTATVAQSPDIAEIQREAVEHFTKQDALYLERKLTEAKKLPVNTNGALDPALLMPTTSENRDAEIAQLKANEEARKAAREEMPAEDRKLRGNCLGGCDGKAVGARGDTRKKDSYCASCWAKKKTTQRKPGRKPMTPVVVAKPELTVLEGGAAS